MGPPNPENRKVKIIGPPHLLPYAVPVEDEDREALSLYPVPQHWQRSIRCKCLSRRFSIKYTGGILEEGVICDTESERQRIDLACTHCSQSMSLFDAYLHGYDPVICGHGNVPPKKRMSPASYACACGGTAFSLAVDAEYSLDLQELADLEPEQWDHTFTWFCSKARCFACGRVVTLVDYECA